MYRVELCFDFTGLDNFIKRVNTYGHEIVSVTQNERDEYTVIYKSKNI